MSASTQRVAVIAVHGVADQRQDETAFAVAKLIGADAAGPALEEERLVIPVSGHIPKPATTQADAGIELSRTMTEHHLSEPMTAAYETIRYRIAADGAKPQVDVYELYWADLSRLAPGAWRLLSELYQLLFHLASISERVLKDAIADTATCRVPFRIAHRLAADSLYLLSCPIFFFNLGLLIALTTLGSVFLPAEWQPKLAQVLIAISAIAGLVLVAYTSGRPRISPLLATGIAAVLLAVTLWTAAGPLQLIAAGHVILVFAFVAAAGLAMFLVHVFGRLRPGSEGMGYVCIVFASITIVWALCHAFNAAPVAAAGGWAFSKETAIVGGLWATEVMMLVLTVAWIVKLLVDLSFGISAGCYLVCARNDGVQRTINSTALKTATLGILLSAAGFLMITLTLWAALLVLAKSALMGSLSYSPLLPLFADPTVTDVAGMGDALLARSATFYGITAVVLIVLLGLLVIAILPSMVVELAPQITQSRYALGAEERLGKWLTSWLGFIAWAIGLAFLLYLFLSGIYLLDYLLRPPGRPPGSAGSGTLATLIASFMAFSNELNQKYLSLVGTLLAGTTVTLMALGNRLQNTFGKVRLALDVLLDVDNYLREHPFRSNPRSRIFARLDALLAHVTSPAGKYDAVVFVAHSQGTAITADYLRLRESAQASKTEASAVKPRWQFLSVGCPVRQLYAAHFPHWYAWSLDASADRQADSLGVERWINVYGAGDYVGRRVFDNNDATDFFKVADVAQVPALCAAHRQLDLCGGPFAHTHYLDGRMPIATAALQHLVGR